MVIDWVVAMRLDGRRFFGVPRLAPHLSSIPRQLFGEKRAADCFANFLVRPWLGGLARAASKHAIYIYIQPYVYIFLVMHLVSKLIFQKKCIDPWWWEKFTTSPVSLVLQKKLTTEYWCILDTQLTWFPLPYINLAELKMTIDAWVGQALLGSEYWCFRRLPCLKKNVFWLTWLTNSMSRVTSRSQLGLMMFWMILGSWEVEECRIYWTSFGHSVYKIAI